MGRRRLTGGEIAAYLAKCPSELCDLVLEARDLVDEVAGACIEALKFGCLCYFKPRHPYGAIGGNVCMIHARDDHIRIAFIHGASLADPVGLLHGTAKAKRFIEIRSAKELRRPAVAALIRAALAYSPIKEEGAKGRRQARRA